MTRVSKKLVKVVSREEMEAAFAAYNERISQLQVLEGKMNTELTRVKEKYEARISQLQEERDEQFEVMQVWAEANDEQFAKRKSIDLTHGTIGFRTCPPKLVTRKGFKWGGVLELVKAAMPGYVRTKEDLDKERLLADRETVDLKALGMEVAQDETFYVTPKLENVALS